MGNFQIFLNFQVNIHVINCLGGFCRPSGTGDGFCDVCDPKKIIERGCLGAPDLIVEILSPSTSKKDLNEKFQLYEKHGVQEYWIADPRNKYIRVFHLITDGNKISKYDDGILTPPANWQENNNFAESTIFKGFRINVKELFD